MSLMTENKARRLLKEYMDAELKGDDSLAKEIEANLISAGWKISVGAEGYTVIRENGGLFNTDSTDNEGNTPYQNQQYTPPYTGTTKGSSNNTPMIIGISVGALILIIAIILGVKAYKQSKHVVSG